MSVLTIDDGYLFPDIYQGLEKTISEKIKSTIIVGLTEKHNHIQVPEDNKKAP